MRRYYVTVNFRFPDKRRGITWFVSRHPGAIGWAKGQGIVIDRWVEHLDPVAVAAGDVVLGTLPVNVAAEVCARGARYCHLSLNVPAQWRGLELSSDDLQHFGVRIISYCISPLTHDFPVALS
jgi:CRISPR-associated protein Csx16